MFWRAAGQFRGTEHCLEKPPTAVWEIKCHFLQSPTKHLVLSLALWEVVFQQT